MNENLFLGINMEENNIRNLANKIGFVAGVLPFTYSGILLEVNPPQDFLFITDSEQVFKDELIFHLSVFVLGTSVCSIP